MEARELNGIRVGSRIVILIGPFRGNLATVMRIGVDEGCATGWFTCRAASGQLLMFAGNEIRKANLAEERLVERI